MGAVKARHLPWRTSERPLPARGQSPMPPWRVHLNHAVINRVASRDWKGPKWQAVAVAAWQWSNCAAEPLPSHETIAIEAILPATKS